MSEMVKNNDPVMEDEEYQRSKQQLLEWQQEMEGKKQNMNDEKMCQSDVASPYYYQQQREYLHNFLIHAKNAGCNVDQYIEDEINRMLAELER